MIPRLRTNDGEKTGNGGAEGKQTNAKNAEITIRTTMKATADVVHGVGHLNTGPVTAQTTSGLSNLLRGLFSLLPPIPKRPANTTLMMTLGLSQQLK